MKLSKRILTLQASPIRKFAPLVGEAVKAGKKVYSLHIGQPEIETPDVFFEAIGNFDEKVLGYAPSQGHPALIRALVAYYETHGITFGEQEVMITNGASEALFFALAAVADPGDEVLVPEPYYTNYNGYCQLQQITICPITTYAETGFCLPPREEIESLITERTRAILLSNPGNPTGAVYSEEEVRTVATIALQHDLFIIADEVYREFIYDDLTSVSFGQLENVADRVILVDSISKRFSACGARIGSIASRNEQLMAELMKLAQSRLSVPTLEQVGAAALYRMDRRYFSEVKATYSRRCDLVFRMLNEMPGVLCKKSRGAFYTMAKLPVEDAEAFVTWLLTDFGRDGETVMVAPAVDFYASEGLGKEEIRIACVLEDQALERAMDLLREALALYTGANES